MTRKAIARALGTSLGRYAEKRGSDGDELAQSRGAVAAGAHGRRARSHASAALLLGLLLGLLAMTAPAHATSSLATGQAHRLSAYNTMQIGANCEGMTVHGFYFVAGPVTLTATQKGSSLTVSPNVFIANATNGNFVGTISICGIVFGSPVANVFLIGIGSNGVQSQPVNIAIK